VLPGGVPSPSAREPLAAVFKITERDVLGPGTDRDRIPECFSFLEPRVAGTVFFLAVFGTSLVVVRLRKANSSLRALSTESSTSRARRYSTAEEFSVHGDIFFKKILEAVAVGLYQAKRICPTHDANLVSSRTNSLPVYLVCRHWT
jgi:hypothetical protein